MKLKETAFHRKLTAIVVFSVTLLTLGNLLATNILATSGERLRNLEERTEELKEQNDRLRTEIIRLSSLETLQERATSLGLTTNIQTLNLPSQPPIAMNQGSSTDRTETP